MIAFRHLIHRIQPETIAQIQTLRAEAPAREVAGRGTAFGSRVGVLSG